MHKHTPRSNVAESKDGVFQGTEIGGADGVENLGGKRGAEVVPSGDVVNCFCVNTKSNGDSGSGAHGRRRRTWMDGNNERDTCASEVLVVTENHSQVPMEATSACGWDRARVRKQLSLQ